MSRRNADAQGCARLMGRQEWPTRGIRASQRAAVLAMRTLNFEEGGEQGAQGAGALRGYGKGSGEDSVGNSAAMRMAIVMSRTVGRLLRMAVNMWMF